MRWPNTVPGPLIAHKESHPVSRHRWPRCKAVPGSVPDWRIAASAAGRDHRDGLIRGASRRSQHLGDSEVQQFRFTLLVDQNVARFQIAMDHQMLMREMNRGANLTEQFQTLPNGKLA